MASDPKILRAGTDRMQGEVNFSPKKIVMTPRTVKGQRDYVRMMFTMDWNGELYTVHMDAPINAKQALTATYFAELSAKVNQEMQRGLSKRM